MHLLLTRPDGRNAPLAQKLAVMGVRATSAPMIALTPNPDAGPSPLSRVDGAFFVSPSAVHFAHQALQGQWPKLHYFAVGGGTAQALKSYGVTPYCPPFGQETSEGVLALPQWQELKAGTIAIVRGVGGRELMASELTSRGFSIEYWQLYRRECPTWSLQDVLQWPQNGVNVILATSGEVLENIFNVTPKPHHLWLQQCLWLVPVARVAEQAHKHGCQKVQITGGAGDDAIIRSLGSLNHYGENLKGT